MRKYTWQDVRVNTVADERESWFQNTTHCKTIQIMARFIISCGLKNSGQNTKFILRLQVCVEALGEFGTDSNFAVDDIYHSFSYFA